VVNEFLDMCRRDVSHVHRAKKNHGMLAQMVKPLVQLG
jgi:hypothetical protein